MKFAQCAVAAALLAAAGAVAGIPPSANNPAMLELAKQSGCLTCHVVESSTPASGTEKPIGPAWQDVANKYKGQKAAADKLTATVMQGSNPYESHWKGKVTGLAMPPNAVAIDKAHAELLVRWILSLAN